MGHIEDLASDFVLGLLLPADRKRVLSHIVECKRCRTTIAEERQMIEDVQGAFQRATDYNMNRLPERMPDIPGRSYTFFDLSTVRPAVAALAIAIIAVGGLLLALDRGNVSNIQVTQMHTIATSINMESPTFTATATASEDGGGDLQGASLLIPGSTAPRPEITPESVQSGG